MSFKIGEVVGPYRIIAQLGQGGMATVYKAYHATLDRYVALKVLHPALNEDQSFLARFQREARLVARLEHPHIVPVYDYAEYDRQPFLVMKFVEGETLKARLSREALSAGEIVKVVESVGSALAYAHGQGILHRDVKPSNVLIAAEGEIYLTDFGVARIAQMEELPPSIDTIMGTPQYISPEQAMGTKELDERTDIYSLGVMVYEMVVGRVPFPGDTPVAIVHDHIYTPVPLARRGNPNVPEPVQRVLLKALAKDRLDRYPNIQEMVASFKNAWRQAGIPMDTRPVMRIPVMQPAPALEGEERADAAQVAVPGGSAAEDPRAASEPPVIEAAIELVAKDPADPEAHLQLALTYWDSGQPPRAAEELAQTASRTGASDRDFLMKAANQFRARGVWSATAAIFLSLIETYPANQTPPEMVEAFHETVYRAAQARELPLFLPFERIDRVDQPLGFIARGRHALYHGTLEDAWLNLDQAQRLRPGLFTVALLEAEIGSGQGYPERHRAILTSLSSDPGAPAWIRTMAGSRLRAMP